MDQVEKYVFDLVVNHSIQPKDASNILKLISENENEKTNDIAIIGMSCRFSNADNYEEYWQNIMHEINCIREFPERRKDYVQQFYKAIDSPYIDLPFMKAGFLESIEQFDESMFRISPREAKEMDPFQRMFLTVAFEAMEDAGYTASQIYGTKTGVFAGRDHTPENPYKHIAGSTEPLVMTGTWTGIVASRFSYIFNLQGPSMIIDTSCSSGLTGVHLACESLRRGECDMAIAGGVHLEFTAKQSLNPTFTMIESEESCVRSFSSGATGTVWGEGVAAVFLKPLERAKRDGDHILGVIKGSAMNNDGASNGLTAPNAQAQSQVLIDAWKNAKVDPKTIQYIEAHGTGTELGDPIEIKGIQDAFSRYTDKKQFCGIGTVKTNIGHTVAASGIASLIKVILAMQHGVLPPSINFKQANSYINFTDSPVYFVDRIQKWKKGENPRRAGISAFSFNGTNVHLVLEEPESIVSGEEIKEKPELFVLSAKNDKSLKHYVEDCYRYINVQKNDSFDSIIKTAQVNKEPFENRLAFVVKDVQELKRKLKYIADNGLQADDTQKIFYGEIKGKHKNIQKLDNSLVERVADIDRQTVAQQAELLNQLAQAFVEGKQIDFAELFHYGTFAKARLPIYPLDFKRYWPAEPFPEKKDRPKEIEHPLLNKCLVQSIDTEIYLARLSPKMHWVLSEHKIQGHYVLPGTAYIEMIREVINLIVNEETVTLKDLVFISPLIVEPEETKDVQIIIKEEEGGKHITVASKEEMLDTWVKHVETVWVKSEKEKVGFIDIDGLKAKLSRQTVQPKEEQNDFFTIGDRWKSTSEIYMGKDELLCTLKLPEQFEKDLVDYTLHPALLDNAVNFSIQNIGDGMYLPYAYKKIKILHKMPNVFYSLVRKKDNIENTEIITADAWLMDQEGNVFVEIEDYSIKKVHSHEFENRYKSLKGQQPQFYKTGWEKTEEEPDWEEKDSGNILVFEDTNGLGSKAKELYGNQNIITVSAGNQYAQTEENHFCISPRQEDYNRLLQALKDKQIDKIVHLMSCDEQEKFESQKQNSITSLFYLAKALINSRISNPIELVLVTRYAYRIGDTERIRPFGNALFGLGSVIAQENESVTCRCIDVDESTKTEVLMKEVFQGTSSSIAYRANERYIRTLDVLEAENEENENKKTKKAVDWKEDGAYIITGGTGGIGSELVNYLTANSMCKLVLWGRSERSYGEEWNQLIDDRRIQIAQVDVTDMNAVNGALTDVRVRYGKINGIFHCAGVAGNGFLFRKNEREFMEAIAAKVEGTRNLELLTRQDSLDFLILFSSITAYTGGPGQSDYTTANAFMDSFASLLRSEGIPTYSVNWPLWKDIGMSAAYHVNENMSVFKAIELERAISAMEKVLQMDYANLIFGVPNYELIAKAAGKLPFAISSETMRRIINKYSEKKGSHAGEQGNIDEMESIVFAGKTKEECSETERKLVYIWAYSFSCQKIDVYANFMDYGGDSIIATQIYKEIVSKVCSDLDISDIFTYPTIVGLAKVIEERMGIKEPEETVSEEMSDDQLKKMLQGIKSGSLSVEHATQLLEKR